MLNQKQQHCQTGQGACHPPGPRPQPDRALEGFFDGHKTSPLDEAASRASRYYFGSAWSEQSLRFLPFRAWIDPPTRERDHIRMAARHGPIGWKQTGQARIIGDSACLNQHRDFGAARAPSKGLEHAAEVRWADVYHYQVLPATAVAAHLFGRDGTGDFDLTNVE